MNKHDSQIWYTANRGRYKQGDRGLSSFLKAWRKVSRSQFDSLSRGLADNISLLGKINASRDLLLLKSDDPQAQDWRNIGMDIMDVMHRVESEIPDSEGNALEISLLKLKILEILHELHELRTTSDLEVNGQVEESAIETVHR